MRRALVTAAALCAMAACKDDATSGSITTASTSSRPQVTATATASASTSPPCVEGPPDKIPYEAPPKEDLMPTPERVGEALAALHERHRCTSRLVEIGRSHLGRPIHALEIGRGEPDGKPTFFVNAVHHGDEPLSAAFVLDAARYLLSRRGTDARVDRYLEQTRSWLVPVVNPDGLFAYVTKRFEGMGLKKPGRKNARDNDGDGKFGPNDGVDLNRNYPFKWGYLGEEGSTAAWALHTFRGPSAGSEPETKAVLRLANAEVFAGSISYHVGGIAMLVPYTIDRVRDPKPNEAWAVARQVAAQMSKHPDAVAVPPYPVQRNLYSVDGTDQDWHRAAHGTLALLVEGALRGSAAATDLKRRSAIVVALRSSWMGLLDRYLDGPVIEGRVLDAEGRPVAAKVRLATRELHEGEEWKSRCRDGFFARWLESDGPQTVEVTVPGTDRIVTKAVEVKGRTKVTIQLPAAVPAATCPPRPSQ